MAIQKEEEEENKELCVCWKCVALALLECYFLCCCFLAVLDRDGLAMMDATEKRKVK